MKKINGVDRKEVLRLLREFNKGNTFSISPVTISDFESIEATLDAIANRTVDKVLELANEITKELVVSDVERYVKLLVENGMDEENAKKVVIYYKLQLDRAIFLRLLHELIGKISAVATVGDELTIVRMSLALNGVDGKTLKQLMKGEEEDKFKDVF